MEKDSIECHACVDPCGDILLYSISEEEEDAWCGCLRIIDDDGIMHAKSLGYKVIKVAVTRIE